MPPALSDEEISASSGDERIPAKKGRKGRKEKKVEPEPEEEDVEEEVEGEEEEDEDEYVVEAIVNHKNSKGTILYHVKWQGYDDPKDMTWEGEDNLEGVEALAEYHQSIGGRPDTKKRGRKSGANTGTNTGTSTPVAAKRMKKEQPWAPPAGSWEDHVDSVETVEQRINPKTGLQEKYGYLIWKHQSEDGNQIKTQHPLQLIFKKCPQKMLAYFEEHLVFNSVDAEEDINGNAEMTGVDDEL